MAGVAAVFGQLERELIAERTREALARLRDEGRTYGPVPYGFDSLDGLLVENAQEQRYLAEILAMRNGGMSYGSIADWLNAECVPAKRGGSWSPMAVRSVWLTAAKLRQENAFSELAA